MKPFLIKLTTAALNLCNAIVSGLWVLVVAGIIGTIAFVFLPDPAGASGTWERNMLRFVYLVPFMGTYMLSSACLRRILMDNLGGDLPAIFAVGVVIFFIGHLSLVIGLGMHAGYLIFQPPGSFETMHSDIAFERRVLHVEAFGAVSFLFLLLPCFVLYSLSRDKSAALALPSKAIPSCFDEMFSKHTFLASGILSVIIISLALLIGS